MAVIPIGHFCTNCNSSERIIAAGCEMLCTKCDKLDNTILRLLGESQAEAKKMDKKLRVWTREDLNELEKLYFLGTKQKDIAKKLGRTKSSVAQKIIKEGLVKKRKHYNNF